MEWRHLQALQQNFWVQWKETYLHTLAKRPKWLEIQRNFQPDDLVLITEDNFTPTIWPLARITEGSSRLKPLKGNSSKGQ